MMMMTMIMMMRMIMNTYPSHYNTPGLFGMKEQAQSFVTNNMTLLAVIGVAGLLYMYRK